ncbi:MAG TPA: SAM-dependent methyltransferase [Chloroflexia bacterium]|nr:SAM-dependent methyltransferase [Chloroflexia bacterium]
MPRPYRSIVNGYEEPLGVWIREQIKAHGPVTVAQFMEWALYHPEYGYYTTGPNIGPRGDFTTSPEASTMFGRLLAKHVSEIDTLLGHPSLFHIVEFGPGRGTLARDLLDKVQQTAPSLYRRLHYWLVEVSPALAATQRERLLPAHSVVARWASGPEQVPRGLVGAVIANEFVDAFPVHVVEHYGGAVSEQYVGLADDGALRLTYGPPSDPRLLSFLQRYNIALESGQRIEINLGAEEWAKQLGRIMAAGVVTVIDYGDTSPSRYSEARREGTLLGYYGGAVAHDILAHPGRQDLTALVDFSAMLDSCREAGFDLLGMTRQANFLIGLGLGTEETVEGSAADVQGALDIRRGLQALVSMEGLGRFHVMLLSRGIDIAAAQSTLSGLKYASV